MACWGGAKWANHISVEPWPTTMTSTNRTPYLTFNMLIDTIPPENILYKPESAKQKTFKWVSSIHWERGTIPEKGMAIVCKSKVAHEADKLFPESLLIILADAENKTPLPELCEDLKNRPAQAIIVSAPTPDNLLQKMQNRFLEIQNWQSQLNGIETSSSHAIADVLAKSSAITKVPILIYDANLKLLAKSRYNEAAPFCKEFAKREAEILNSISMLNKPLIPIKGRCPFFASNTVISGAGDEIIYHMVALHEKPPTPGQKDFLEILSNYILAKSGRITAAHGQTGYETYTLFDDIINERYVSRARLEKYAFLIGLPLNSEFKLLRFKLDPKTTKEGQRELIECIKHINDGRSIPLSYRDDVIALLHSRGNDDSLAIQMIEEELRSQCPQLNGFATSSQVFSEIGNLSFAYKQTGFVAKYKDLIDLEREFVTANRDGSPLCYTFEDALMFALVDSDDMTQEMKDFAFSHTMLGKIIAEDIANGTEDARILASYLHYERKATIVAEKLHMHRNTVLYRIEKIEKRFYINFNESWSRNRAMTDFSTLYCKLSRNPELYRKLLGEHEGEPQNAH